MLSTALSQLFLPFLLSQFLHVSACKHQGSKPSHIHVCSAETSEDTARNISSRLRPSRKRGVLTAEHRAPLPLTKHSTLNYRSKYCLDTALPLNFPLPKSLQTFCIKHNSHHKTSPKINTPIPTNNHQHAFQGFQPRLPELRKLLQHHQQRHQQPGNRSTRNKTDMY